jgi:hypothetical protein
MIDSGMFLPEGLIWVGFDAEGFAVVASVERVKPRIAQTSRGIFYGCESLHLCDSPPQGELFGAHIDAFRRYTSLTEAKRAIAARETKTDG